MLRLNKSGLLGFVTRSIKSPVTSCHRQICHTSYMLNQNTKRDTDGEIITSSAPSNSPPPTDEELPWYLREQADVPSQRGDVILPQPPQHAPQSVETFLNLIGHDYGLEDIQLFDLTTLQQDHPHSTNNQPFDYVIIASGKSEKHIYKAGQELKQFLKHEYSVQGRINGLVSAAPSPVARRRMLKRANKSPPATDNDFGMAANSWVMCETLVDNVCIHFLTKPRRQELNLESLWVDESVEEANANNDSVQDVFRKDVKNVPPFFLSRRHFHSSIRCCNNELSKAVYRKVLDSKVSSITTTLIEAHIEEFETNFQGLSSRDYNLKTDFYRLLHVVSPEVVSLRHFTNVILDKYIDLQFCLSEQTSLQDERVKDLVTFMKVLLDSPEINAAPLTKGIADTRYDLLSKFTADIYRLTGDEISLNVTPEIIPLLLKLSFIKNTSGHELGSSIIDQTIYEQKDTNYTFSTDIVAENRVRDATDLIDYYISLSPKSVQLSSSVKELQLFSYGNSKKWDLFWETWNTNNLLTNKGDIKRWLRLIVYLGLRNEPEACSTFLTEYFLSSTKVSGAFITDFKQHFEQFSTIEKDQLKHSLSIVLEYALQYRNLAKSEEIKAFINAL